MTLVDDGKVIIEVGLNEMASKEENSNVPYSWEEVAREAVACAGAGASIIHFHARYDNGEQAKTDDAVYRSAMAAIAASCDVLTFPTSFQLPGSDLWSADQLPHHWALIDDPPRGAPLRIGAFDGFRIGPRPLIAADGRLIRRVGDSLGQGKDNYLLPDALRAMLDRGLLPSISCYEVGEARWVRLVAQAGLLPQPVRVQFQLFASYALGLSPTPDTVDAFLNELELDGGIDAEVEVVGYGIRDLETYSRLLHHSLDRRINIRVGLGDCPTVFPDARNADLVAWAVELVHAHGLEPATSHDIRTRFGM